MNIFERVFERLYRVHLLFLKSLGTVKNMSQRIRLTKNSQQVIEAYVSSFTWAIT